MGEQFGHEPVVFSLFVIFSGAALLATLALFARQALPVAYIVLGMAIGPHGLAFLDDPQTVRGMAEIGIIFLLFLLGLDLAPKGLIHMVRKATVVTLVSSALFAGIGFIVSRLFGFATMDALLIGAAMMFSSTIIGLKLLPTTALHHQRMGEIIIAVLLLQDLIAIAILMLVGSAGRGGDPWLNGLLVLLGLPALLAFAFLCARYILIPLIRKFDKIREYIFLTAIGWCLGVAELGSMFGLSHAIGAFVAGVALATSPIALYIAESLKPLRDFFLILFFFSMGAAFNLDVVGDVLAPAVCLAGLMLVVKPVAFEVLLRMTGEAVKRSREVAARLGQVSEFSLLIALMALESGAVSSRAAYLVQAATLLTFVVSTYVVVLRYPTPVAISDRLRRD